jgi:hypothetical protein
MTLAAQAFFPPQSLFLPLLIQDQSSGTLFNIIKNNLTDTIKIFAYIGIRKT